MTVERTNQQQALGERLRLARKAAGVSQIDVAEACGTTRAFISLVEKGETGIDPEKVEAIASFLRIEVQWLARGTGKAPNLKPPEGVRRALRPANSTRLGWSDHVSKPPFDGAIPLMNEQAGASTPLDIAQAKRVREWILLPPFVLQQVGANTDTRKLRIMEMAANLPKVPRGSFVLIDQSKLEPRDGEVYAINNQLSIVLRRIVEQVGQPSKVGLADEAGTQIIARDKLKVRGKVVMVMQPM